MSQAHVEIVAHHWILLAVPAFLPAIIVVAVVLYVALRDRRGCRKPRPLRAVSRPEDASDSKSVERDERTGTDGNKG
nr:hypothetical protein [Mycobacterium sp. Marseille-P9652]